MARCLRRRRPRRRTLLLAGALLFGVVTAAPAAAEASAARGYAWTDRLSPGRHVLYGPYAFNSSGGETVLQVETGTDAETGADLVGYGLGFEGLPPVPDTEDQGVTHVTAYGPGPRSCHPDEYHADRGDRPIAFVVCSDVHALLPSQFTVSYVRRPAGSQPFAYLRYQRVGTAFVTGDSFSSAGGTNSVTRTGLGSYTVRLPLLGAASGHVQVTAYTAGVVYRAHGLSAHDDAAARCKVAGWGPTGTNQQVFVRCFSLSGLPKDSGFTLTYVENTGIQRVNPAAYVWANNPTAGGYTPGAAYQFNSALFAGPNTIRRLGTGVYRVRTPGQPLDRGTAQVTAYGNSPDHCKVDHWNPTDGIEVHCYTATGAPVDSRFTMAFQG